MFQICYFMDAECHDHRNRITCSMWHANWFIRNVCTLSTFFSLFAVSLIPIVYRLFCLKVSISFCSFASVHKLCDLKIQHQDYTTNQMNLFGTEGKIHWVNFTHSERETKFVCASTFLNLLIEFVFSKVIFSMKNVQSNITYGDLHICQSTTVLTEDEKK